MIITEMSQKEVEQMLAGTMGVQQKSIGSRATGFITNRIDRVVDRVVLAAGNFTLLAVTRAARGLNPHLTSSQMDFTLSGKKGETLIVREWPEEWFKPEKLVVIETAPDKQFRDTPQDTILTGAFVGAMNMFPTAPSVDSGISSAFFASNAIGTGIAWKPCRHGQSITFMVTFKQDCTWHGTLFGKLDSRGLLRRWPWSLVA